MHAIENIVMKDSEAKAWHNFTEELLINLLIVVLIITDFVFIFKHLNILCQGDVREVQDQEYLLLQFLLRSLLLLLLEEDLHLLQVPGAAAKALSSTQNTRMMEILLPRPEMKARRDVSENFLKITCSCSTNFNLIRLWVFEVYPSLFFKYFKLILS